MENYHLKTRIGWTETYRSLVSTMQKWGIHSWNLNEPKGVRYPNSYQSEEDRRVILDYKYKSKDIRLIMDKQSSARDNLRVIYLAVESMRMNDKRGIGEVIESAYLQLAAPPGVIDPYELLGVRSDAPMTIIEAAYRAQVKDNHPDHGGNGDKMAELNHAMDRIRKDKGL